MTEIQNTNNIPELHSPFEQLREVDADDNVESNCSMTRKYSSKRSEFLRFYLYLCHVIPLNSLVCFATLR